MRQSTYRQKVNDAQSPRVSERRYAYNNQGLLGRIDDALRGTTRYQYDALERLTKVQGPNPETFVHDPAGNILHIQSGSGEQKVQTSFQQSKGNRLSFQGDTHYKYDDRGNRVAQGRGKNKSIRSFYKYNALNQLVAIKNNKGQTQYAYDPLGRRIIKSSKEKRTGFLWLDNVLLSEITQNISTDESQTKQVHKTYLYEPGTFKPLALVKDKKVYHYHLDHLGTPQVITDSKGKLVWAVSYRAYGNLAVAHKNEIENNLRFQGQYYDEESGLHYNRFRYYDPECGRFINQDPIGLLGGLNNYQYVPNPTGWVDPFGLACSESEVVSYRGDGRERGVIFNEGFSPKGTSTDLQSYAATNEPSVFVSASKDPEVAIDFATVYGTRDGTIYSVRTAIGVDVNETLGSKSPFPEEHEIAVPGGISPDQVLGATPVNADGSYARYTILNPKVY